ncbi:hypothetical protein CYMTET_21776 [Cymbomonas tetramitiformis]|uniref:Uncharacterized protein n=1 Tax=Cymbomonas tetramitiformis TaxID=36881 RepID=A0AAE0L2Y3_9CHLO|nr:hypothetical protein CYMTET_21776 [Cymbomonas tetramitiformis]
MVICKWNGIILMEIILTQPSFYTNVHDWVFLFEHCVLKTQNEAVVESEGSVIDKHAAGGRHLSQEALMMESVVHWNAPAAHRSDNFIRDALNHHFGCVVIHVVLDPERILRDCRDGCYVRGTRMFGMGGSGEGIDADDTGAVRDGDQLRRRDGDVETVISD